MNRQAAAVMLAMALSAAATARAAEVTPLDVTFAEDGSIAESLTGVPGNPEDGAKHMVDRALGNCAACHKIGAMPDVPFQGNIGPELDGAAGRWTEAQLRGIVADAKHTFPDSMMPSFYKVAGYVRPGVAFTSKPAEEPLPPLLTAQQIEDIVAYLLTLK